MTNDDKAKRINLPAGTSSAMGDAAGTAKLTLDLGKSIFRTLGGRQAHRRMRDERREQRAEQARTLAAPPAVHGSARWADADDLRGQDYLRSADAYDAPNARDILLGAFPAEEGTGWLYWGGGRDHEGHLITVAPTRSGKSTTLIVPNLLRYGGSCVVLDPKGELYRLTSKWRSTLGPVHRIAPFEAVTDAFNPLDAVKSPADARALADLLMPEDPHASGFFRKDAIAFLNGLIQFVNEECPPSHRHLAEVRRLTALSTDNFLDMARRMSTSANPAVVNAGNIVLGKARDRGLPSLRETLNTELSLWDDEGVARATGPSTVDFRALKDRTSTVYITVPFDKMSAFAPLQKVLLTAALDAMVQNPVVPQIPVLFVLDEFLSLGPFPGFREAIRTHASAGARLWFFLQNLAMLKEHYPTSWESFYDASVQMFFGTSDPFTAKLISETVDDTTVAQRNTTYTLGHSVSREDFFETGSGESLNVTSSVTLSGRRLITPGEVVQRLGGTHPDGTREAIVYLKGVPPVMTRLVPYFLGRKAMQRIGEKP